MLCTKEEWLVEFRSYAEKTISDLNSSEINYKEKAKKINEKINTYRNAKLATIKQKSNIEHWDNKHLLDEVLRVTYVSYIVMLEYRNKIWPYEYMAFTRRIGELWEPFCKLAFEYPVNKLKMISPPYFDDVKKNIKQKATKYIDLLPLSSKIKNTLKEYNAIPWRMVDSECINLSLDMHFEQAGVHYHCDFKSGFNSNEKGNTNRLLVVGSIYSLLGSSENTLIFVRQDEDENNHYLQLLKNSHYWNVFCAEDCYEKMKSFTGFDIRTWLNDNVDWEHDISDELKKHLENNDLLRYLTW